MRDKCEISKLKKRSLIMDGKKVGFFTRVSFLNMVVSLLGFAQLFCVMPAIGARKPVQQRRVVASKKPVARRSTATGRTPKMAIGKTPQQHTAELAQKIKNVINGSASDDSKINTLKQIIPAPKEATQSVSAAADVAGVGTGVEDVEADVESGGAEAPVTGLTQEEEQKLEQEKKALGAKMAAANIAPNMVTMVWDVNQQIMSVAMQVKAVLGYHKDKKTENSKEAQAWKHDFDLLDNAQKKLKDQATNITTVEINNILDLVGRINQKISGIKDKGEAEAIQTILEAAKPTSY